jgi:membrane associated rhomboid family serine protease
MDAVFFEAPADRDPRRPPRPDRPGHRAPHREPLINAPWAAAMIASVIVGGYEIQSQFPLGPVVYALGFRPDALASGHWERLVTYMFAHGNWAHALMNAAFGLAFGAAVARWFGERFANALLFFSYYLLCGVLSALAWGLLHPDAAIPVVGASGAVSGLMGGAARVVAGHGRLGPLLSRTVAAWGGAWLIINLIMGFAGGGLIPGTGGAAVAWEIHVAGFVIGAVGIGPFAWLLRRLA